MSIITQIILAFSISFVVSIIVGFLIIPVLNRRKAAQSIREDGPVWHNKKQGTPTLGGIIFICGMVVATLVIGCGEMVAGNFTHLYVLIFALIFALIGFIDDYKKLKRERNLGLRARHKFILQLLVAVAFIFFLEFNGNLTTNLYIPFIDKTVYIPMALYNIFAAFVIVGTVNSVNITDGADGLVTGVTIPVMIFFTVIAFLWNAPENSVIAAAAVGGLAAFLFFNFYPAKVFMGDTGSLFLGGLVCAMAFALDIPLLLITLGFVYFVETASDIIQVTYFKLTKGKRVFKMAPIHHHFEMCGWSEYKLFTIFTTVSAVFVIISYFGVFRRYL